MKGFLKYLPITILWLALIRVVPAQTAPGQWRDHLPYNEAFRVVLASEKTYAATRNAIFSYDHRFSSLEKLSRVQGLSDMGISCFEYIPDRNLLFVGYSNGNIDLIGENGISNLSDIKRYTQITGNKQINHLLQIGQHLCLSTGFGIIILDPDKKEIRDTYYIGQQGNPLEVFQTATDGVHLYASTPEGIRRAPLNDPNLVNYEVWETWNDVPEAGALYPFIGIFSQDLVVVREGDDNDILYHRNGNTWEVVASGVDIKQLRTSPQHLYLVTEDKIIEFNIGLELSREINNYGFGNPHPQDVAPDASMNLWIADRGEGMVYLAQNGSGQWFRPDGPLTSDVWHISAARGRIYASGGGLDAAWNNVFLSGIVYVFHEEEWNNLIDYSVRDAVRTLVDPSDPDHFWVATWGYGIIEYQDNVAVNRYDASNSSLQSIISGQNYVRIGGLAMDRARNIWATNSGVPRPVSVLTTEGWTGLDLSIDAPTLGDILVTAEDHKWIILPRGNGLFAFDDRGTPGNTSDDLTRKFSPQDESGNTITSDVFSIAEDRDGSIWIGTAKGPLVYFNPGQVFGGDFFYASRIKIPGEDPGLANYLLENETITCIAVDGANRKWLGTLKSGAYLVAEDGRQQILHFTTENSPLFSNHVLGIAVDEQTGEVFFGTSRGIVSYRGDATGPKNSFSGAYVFPNPVRENHSGPITITGLMADSWIKITDIAGELVHETRSEGGQATWDGNNLRGEKVKTGVYLVFLSNADGTLSHVIKLLIIH